MCHPPAAPDDNHNTPISLSRVPYRLLSMPVEPPCLPASLISALTPPCLPPEWLNIPPLTATPHGFCVWCSPIMKWNQTALPCTRCKHFFVYVGPQTPIKFYYTAQPNVKFRARFITKGGDSLWRARGIYEINKYGQRRSACLFQRGGGIRLLHVQLISWLVCGLLGITPQSPTLVRAHTHTSHANDTQVTVR